MRRKITTLCFVTVLLLSCALPKAATSAIPDEVTVPGDAEFRLELLSPIGTATNKKGDEFTCRVLEPSEFANAYVTGRITKVKASGKAGGKSEIALAFDRITMGEERSGKFAAQVIEVYDVVEASNQGKADEEGVVKSKSVRKRSALKIGIATAIGAALGALIAGGRGAIIGGAIGAGLGVTNTMVTKGPNLNFEQGTQFVVRTDPRLGRAG